MPAHPDDVRFRGKTGSSRPTTKMTRLTQTRPHGDYRLGAGRVALSAYLRGLTISVVEDQKVWTDDPDTGRSSCSQDVALRDLRHAHSVRSRDSSRPKRQHKER